MSFDPTAIRSAFPTLSQEIDGNPLVYLDTAATALMPQPVIDTMQQFEVRARSNTHRSMHVLAERATVAYEDARKTVQKFINASRPEEIIFTKNCTESINLVAKAGGRKYLKAGDVVVLSKLEHHSNIVPWLQLKDEIGIELKWIDIDDEGGLDLDQYQSFLEEGNVKLIAITGQSNVLGVRPPLKQMIADAHTAGAIVIVDAAQLVAHAPVDVQELDCDFLAFSGHKLYGPTGIGVLYGKRDLLEKMPAFLGGGSMIHEVHEDYFTPADIPQKFEAGTPPIAQAVGLGAAIDWLGQFDWNDIEQHEQELMSNSFKALADIDSLTILGPNNPEHTSGCISFVLNGVHPHDLTDHLGQQGICLRAGHHCTQPLHKRLNQIATTRVSFGIYNTLEDISHFSSSISQIIEKINL